MRRRESCPNCGRSMDRTYSWRDIIRSILCFPCQFYCFRQRCRPTGYCVQRCKACDIKVIQAGGGVPDFARRYRTFKDFSWQFEESPQDQSDGLSSASSRRENFRQGSNLTVDFSVSTQLSYETAHENFKRESATSFQTTTTAVITPSVDNRHNDKLNEQNYNNSDNNKFDDNDNKLLNKKNNFKFSNMSNNSVSGENYHTANEEFAEKTKEIVTNSISHDHNNNRDSKTGGIQNEAFETEDSV